MCAHARRVAEGRNKIGRPRWAGAGELWDSRRGCAGESVGGGEAREILGTGESERKGRSLLVAMVKFWEACVGSVCGVPGSLPGVGT